MDLFFVISAYLLFSHLLSEQGERGRVNVRGFFKRRLLRIVPLLVTYTMIVLLLFGLTKPDWPLRLAGTVGLFDNVLAWFYGYNGSVPAVTHLWTLSYEAQFYVTLPFLLALFLRGGVGCFAAVLATVAFLAAASRAWLFTAGIDHPAVYVTPILRPESILLGLLLAACPPRWHWAWSATAAVLSWALFFVLPLPWKTLEGAVLQYWLIAVAAGGTLDVAVRCPPLRAALSWRPLVALGVVSYGLYVFHFGVRHALRLASPEISQLSREAGTLGEYAAYMLALFAFTALLAFMSYRWLESPFLRRKAMTTTSPSLATLP